MCPGDAVVSPRKSRYAVHLLGGGNRRRPRRPIRLHLTQDSALSEAQTLAEQGQRIWLLGTGGSFVMVPLAQRDEMRPSSRVSNS